MSSGAWVVLVVEDDALVRYSIAEALRCDGFVVLEASSGEDAVALLYDRDNIDVVFTDIQLAGALTGWDVADQCRSARADFRVIYTSGNTADRTRQVAGSHFFGKPYDTGAVVRACGQGGSTVPSTQEGIRKHGEGLEKPRWGGVFGRLLPRPKRY